MGRRRFVLSDSAKTRDPRTDRSTQQPTLSSLSTRLPCSYSLLFKEKALELERSLEDLNEQLSSVRTESNAKDDLLAKQAKVTEEAIAGWEKAEAQALYLKQQLDDALFRKKSAEERVIETDVALKECMQQLRVVKQDQQLFINNAALKISREQEKIVMLEQRLIETNKRLTELVIENGNLNRIIEVKEQLLKELSESKSKSESKLTEVIARLDSSEKLNASLKYEVCILQKEIEIRNEEREFNRRSADAAHRQHLESIKKIAKLETECQKLRVMVRKRLPGPAALAKMRNEVEILGEYATETRKKRTEIGLENFYDTSSKDMTSLVTRLRAIQDENKILKESLTKKNNELQASRIMFARTASKLSQVETQLEELSKGQACFELAKSSPVSHDLPLSSILENGGNEDNVSCAESWASALISELEHFKCGKLTAPSCKSVAISELSLMDDFVEMEKLAVITVDKHFESQFSMLRDNSECLATKESCTEPDPTEETDKELVAIKDLSHFSETNNETQVKELSLENHPIWLQDILRVILKKHHIMQKSLNAILDDVRAALGDWDGSIEPKYSDTLHCNDKLPQQPKNTSSDTFDRAISTHLVNGKSSIQLCQSNLEKPVLKLIELVEGIIQRNIKSKNGRQGLSIDNEGASLANRYIACAFLWEGSELTTILENFVAVCNDLLHGKVDLQQFTAEVTSTLDWIINHCFSLQDVSDMKETVRKHMNADESYTDNELKALTYTTKDIDKLDTHEESSISEERNIPSSSTNALYILSRMEDIESKLKDENERLKHEIMGMESIKNDLEVMLKTSSVKNEELIAQIHQSEESISNLQKELAILKESKVKIEDHIISQNLTNEDLETQLTVAKAELNEVRRKFSALEVELEQKSNCCEELEATCLELQLQLESPSSKEASKDMRPEEKKIQAECDIVAASEKLAACQETILNLGKQLKALASPKDASLFDKVICSPAASKSNQWPQSLDNIKSEGYSKNEEGNSRNKKQIVCTKAPNPLFSASDNPNANLSLNKMNESPIRGITQPSPEKSLGELSGLTNSSKRKGGPDVGMLMVAPKRQGGLSFLRKLLLRRKRNSFKKLALPLGA
ncbi:Plant protein [Musa troglodytarum]|uniref:Plant protein n=1 Tax=Musa troglodytarum TaxID=320322 RepID=A0A9E7I1E1_9LILI|nr:Plant protein [Musa troglodytarum]